MTSIHRSIQELTLEFIRSRYEIELSADQVVINDTKDEYEGDYTIVVFPLAGRVKQNPAQLAEILGAYILGSADYIAGYNVVKGFLNLVMTSDYWMHALVEQEELESVVPQVGEGKIVLEYCSPNSNKPLHLGHVRNILLGWSVGRIMTATGYDIHYTQIVNDRGVAICKSMLSWLKYGEGQTPDTIGQKSDHFVGDAYVRFNEELDKEYDNWQRTSLGMLEFEKRKNQDHSEADFFKAYKNTYFNEHSVLGKETRQMLIEWEENDPKTRSLWNQMNEWFMNGFSETCKRLGVGFDSMNFESNTYLLGKDIVKEGLEKGVFYKEEDNSVWIDLTDAGHDKKLVLRSDGTSVYITQDLGTARTRYESYHMDGMIYTVGNEQNYHFQVLFEILKRLGEPYADQLYHLSYGMVDLPSGRMKTREGTVVDADNLIDEVIEKVAENTEERGELDMLSDEDKQAIIEMIGIGALKYYMLRVDAKKRMVFNPGESVDLQGQTGPYIQNAYVRIRSIMRRLGDIESNDTPKYNAISDAEKQVLLSVMSYGEEVVSAARKYDPSVVAAYAYRLARHFHRFYHDHSIAHAETAEVQQFRYRLAALVADRLKRAMKLLGIEMPERM